METVISAKNQVIGDIEPGVTGKGWFATTIKSLDEPNPVAEEYYRLKRDAIAAVKRNHKALFPQFYEMKNKKSRNPQIASIEKIPQL